MTWDLTTKIHFDNIWAIISNRITKRDEELLSANYIGKTRAWALFERKTFKKCSFFLMYKQQLWPHLRRETVYENRRYAYNEQKCGEVMEAARRLRRKFLWYHHSTMWRPFLFWIKIFSRCSCPYFVPRAFSVILRSRSGWGYRYRPLCEKGEML